MTWQVAYRNTHYPKYNMTTIPLIQSFLRSPDELRAVLEVTQIISDPQLLKPANLHNAALETPEIRNRCIIAVISHKDGWNPAEEGWYVNPCSLSWSVVCWPVSVAYSCSRAAEWERCLYLPPAQKRTTKNWTYKESFQYMGSLVFRWAKRGVKCLACGRGLCQSRRTSSNRRDQVSNTFQIALYHILWYYL